MFTRDIYILECSKKQTLCTSVCVFIAREHARRARVTSSGLETQLATVCFTGVGKEFVFSPGLVHQYGRCFLKDGS